MSKPQDELIARATAIFGAVEEIQLNPGDQRPLGIFLDAAREKLTELHPYPVIAARCGTKLCALIFDFDAPERSQAVLELNPWLRETVWTNWNNCITIWLRIDGWRPGNSDLGHCYWIGGDCLVPATDIKELKDNTEAFPTVRSKDKNILTVEFDKFIWPPDIHEKFLFERMEFEHGPLLEKDVNNLIVLNAPTAVIFWAKLLRLRYWFQEDAFTGFDRKGDWGILHKPQLQCIIHEWLTRKVAQIDTTPPDELLARFIVSELAKFCGINAAEGLRRFVTECVARQADSTVTMCELLIEYEKYCNKQGAAMLPARQFYSEVSGLLRQRFGVAKSHDVSRRNPNGRESAKYGFRNLGITNWSQCPEPSEVSELSEGKAK